MMMKMMTRGSNMNMKEKRLEHFVEGEDGDYKEYKKLARQIPEYSHAFNRIAMDSQRHASYFRRLLLGENVTDFPEPPKRIVVPEPPKRRGKWDEHIREELAAIKVYLAFAEEHKKLKPLMRSIVADELTHLGFLKDVKAKKKIKLPPQQNPVQWAPIVFTSVASIVATLVANAVIAYDINKWGPNSWFARKDLMDKLKEKTKGRKKNPPIEWEVTGTRGKMLIEKGNKKIVITKPKKGPYRFRFYKGNEKLVDMERFDAESVVNLTTSLVTEEPDKIFSIVENVYEGNVLSYLPGSRPSLRNPRREPITLIGKVIHFGRIEHSKYGHLQVWMTIKFPDGTTGGGNLYIKDEKTGRTRPSPPIGSYVLFETNGIHWGFSKKHQNSYVKFQGISFKRNFTEIPEPSANDWWNNYKTIESKIGDPPTSTGGNFPDFTTIQIAQSLSETDMEKALTRLIQGEKIEEPGLSTGLSTDNRHYYESDEVNRSHIGDTVYIDIDETEAYGFVAPESNQENYNVWGPGKINEISTDSDGKPYYNIVDMDGSRIQGGSFRPWHVFRLKTDIVPEEKEEEIITPVIDESEYEVEEGVLEWNPGLSSHSENSFKKVYGELTDKEKERLLEQEDFWNENASADQILVGTPRRSGKFNHPSYNVDALDSMGIRDEISKILVDEMGTSDVEENVDLVLWDIAKERFSDLPIPFQLYMIGVVRVPGDTELYNSDRAGVDILNYWKRKNDFPVDDNEYKSESELDESEYDIEEGVLEWNPPISNNNYKVFLKYWRAR